MENKFNYTFEAAERVFGFLLMTILIKSGKTSAGFKNAVSLANEVRS